MDKKTFINQVAHLFRGQVLYAFTQWIVLAMLARFGGSEESGKYVLALATTAPIFMLFDLNLRVSRSTDHQHHEKYRTYVGLRFCTLVLAITISLLICLLLYPALFGLFLAIIIFRTGDSISNLSFGGYQRMQASDRVGKSLTNKGVLALLLIAIVIPMTSGNALYAACVMAMVSIVWAVFKDLPQSWMINEPDHGISMSAIAAAMTDFPATSRIAKRSLPLGFDAFISSLAFNSPRYCVQWWMGTNALGIFGVLSQLTFSIQMLIGAVGHAGVSVLSNHRQTRDRVRFWQLFNRMLLSSVAVGGIAVLGGTLVIPPVIGYFLGAEYNQTYLVFVLLIASCLTGALRTAGRATQAFGSYFTYTMFDVVVFLTSATCSLLLVGPYGMVGGAWALVAAFGMGAIVALFHTYRFLWPEESHDNLAQSLEAKHL